MPLNMKDIEKDIERIFGPEPKPATSHPGWDNRSMPVHWAEDEMEEIKCPR